MVALGWVLDRSCGKVWRPKHWIGYIIVYRCQLGTSYVSTLPCPLLHHIATIAQYITDISWYAFRTSVERAAALNFKWGAPFETYYTIPYIHIERSYHCVVHVCLVLFFFRFFFLSSSSFLWFAAVAAARPFVRYSLPVWRMKEKYVFC